MIEIPTELLNRTLAALFNAYPNSRIGLELQTYLLFDEEPSPEQVSSVSGAAETARIEDLVDPERNNPALVSEVVRWCEFGLVSVRLSGLGRLSSDQGLEPIEVQIIRHLLRLVDFGMRPEAASDLLRGGSEDVELVRLDSGEWRATRDEVSLYWRLPR